MQLEQATDNLTISNPPVAAEQMVDRMTEQTQVPWTVVTVVLIAVVAVGAVVARKLQLRKGTPTEADPATVHTAAESSATPRAGGSSATDV